MTVGLVPTIAGSALLVGALLSYARWQRTGDALALIVSSFAIAFAGLARYDLFVVGWALALFTWLGPRSRPDGARDERPPYAIAYAAAVSGAFGLWLLTAAVSTGDVLGFVARSMPPTTPSRRIAVEALVVMAPVLALAAIALWSRRAVASAVAAATLAAWASIAAIVSDTWLSLDAVVPLAPLGALLVGQIVTYPVRQVSPR